MLLEHTRALRLAAGATAQSETSLLGHLANQHVSVSVAPRDAADLATAELLLANLARLPINLSLDTAHLGLGPRRLLAAAAHQLGQPDDGATALPVTLRIHIGEGGHADLYAGAEHHGAHLAREPLRRRGPANGLGAVTTAALASGEAFKAITPVVPSRSRQLDSLSWCPVALSTDPSATPLLHSPLLLDDVALIGLGAVGSAIARILGLLGASGRATLVDPERFAVENVGTYSLGTHADAGCWKTELAARALAGVQTTRWDLPVAAFIERVDAGQAAWPALAITGLDSVAARRDAQMLWPRRLLDAATGDTMCGLHDIGPADRACLRCLFPTPHAGPTAAQRLAQATGLNADLLRHGDQPLLAHHLDGLDPEQRQRLTTLVGKPICGLAQAIGLIDLPSDDYRPSVPFVSQQAACLAVGRLLADHLHIASGATFVQYDALVGPDHATLDHRDPDTNCYCQHHAEIVERLQTSRSRKQTASVAPTT